MTNIFLKSIFLFYFRPKGFRGFFVKSWSHFYNVPLSPPTRNPSTLTCRPFFYSVFSRLFSCFLEICICCVMSDEVEADQRKSECSYTKLHREKAVASSLAILLFLSTCISSKQALNLNSPFPSLRFVSKSL